MKILGLKIKNSTLKRAITIAFALIMIAGLLATAILPALSFL
jgi:hypothetical protein